MDDTTALVAVAFGGITLAATLIKDIFGGGTKLANKFHSLETNTNTAMTAHKEKFDAEIMKVRTDFLMRSETYEGNSRVGLEAITASIHTLREAALEQRAKMAEEYMRRDSFYKATDELKRDMKEKNDELKNDMKDGFERVEKTLGDMAQAIELSRKTRNQHA